jgi:histidinol phosphatase-like PHP family hydrolase
MTEAHKMGIPMIISSDAHHYSELTLEFDSAEKALALATESK